MVATPKPPKPGSDAEREFQEGFTLAGQIMHVRGGRPRSPVRRDLVIFDWVTRASKAGYALSPQGRRHGTAVPTAFEYVASLLKARGHVQHIDPQVVMRVYYERRRIERMKARFVAIHDAAGDGPPFNK